MALKTTVFLFMVLVCLLASATAVREISNYSKPGSNHAARELSSYCKPGHNLAARLEANGSLVECWNALNELKSCTTEIVLFFINGQTDIGPDCCRAIEVITRNCWPAMLTALGFTPEEGNILRGYCDASSGPGPGPGPAPLAGFPVGAVVLV